MYQNKRTQRNDKISWSNNKGIIHDFSIQVVIKYLNCSCRVINYDILYVKKLYNRHYFGGILVMNSLFLNMQVVISQIEYFIISMNPYMMVQRLDSSTSSDPLIIQEINTRIQREVVTRDGVTM